jgi:Kef-type K+ transport system membrane component KefB
LSVLDILREPHGNEVLQVAHAVDVVSRYGVILLLVIVLAWMANLSRLATIIGAFGVKNRRAIGVGMMPRGEVGLILAAIGKSLGVLNDALFSAVVLMVVVTTLVSPPLLLPQAL